MIRAAEIAGTSLIAAGTSAVALVEADVAGLAIPFVSAGVAALVGYFSAQITVRSELASLNTEMRLLRQELHRYYRVRSEPEDEA